MHAETGPTDNPFTVAACLACAPAVSATVMPKLRDVVRRCPHAVLIVTQCLTGRFGCSTTSSTPGAMLLLQPCTIDRVPNSSVRRVGPVTSEADAEEVCAWIAAGVWNSADLPVRMRADANLAHASRLN